MKRINFVVPMLLTLFIISCTSVGNIGEENIIEKSSSTPDWISVPTNKGNETVYVTGEMTKAKDRAFGMNQAYADGVRKLLNMMINDCKTQSSQVLRGANLNEEDIGRFSEFAVAWISNTYTIGNVENPETYWEKVEIATGYGVSYNYNCYSRLKMSIRDFNFALEGGFSNMRKKAQEENNKKAEEVANKLIQDLNNKK